jgi:hypothetical protein
MRPVVTPLMLRRAKPVSKHAAPLESSRQRFALPQDEAGMACKIPPLARTFASNRRIVALKSEEAP